MCKRCGLKFTDQRWEETTAHRTVWNAGDQSVCGTCHADDVAREEAAVEAARLQGAAPLELEERPGQAPPLLRPVLLDPPGAASPSAGLRAGRRRRNTAGDRSGPRGCMGRSPRRRGRGGRCGRGRCVRAGRCRSPVVRASAARCSVAPSAADSAGPAGPDGSSPVEDVCEGMRRVRVWYAARTPCAWSVFLPGTVAVPTARCASASTWTVVVAGPTPASDTVLLYGVPQQMGRPPPEVDSV